MTLQNPPDTSTQSKHRQEKWPQKRTVYITPNAAIDSLQPQGPPAGYYWQGVTIRTGCFDQNGNAVPLANVVTASGSCKLGVNFNSGGTSYKLLMSPFPTPFGSA